MEWITGCATPRGTLILARNASGLEHAPEVEVLEWDPMAHKPVWPTPWKWKAWVRSLACLEAEGQRPLLVAASHQDQVVHARLHPLEEQSRVAAQVDRVVHGGGRIWACGANGVIRSAASNGLWVTESPPAGFARRVSGFLGVAASKDDVVAVGYSGDLAVRHAGQWSLMPTGVRATLNAVCATPSGMFWVVGHEGVVLRGNADGWARVETGRPDPEELFLDVAEHEGDLWVVNHFQLLRITDRGVVPEERWSDDAAPPTAFLQLFQGGGRLFCLGPDHVSVFRNNQWQRLSFPG